jgi:hypothetical protein
MESSGERGGNGEAGVAHHAVDTLILTYDRARDLLEVGGKCNSLDLMLDMLARATRVIEGKWRMERAMELQDQLRRQAKNEAVAAALRKGR